MEVSTMQTAFISALNDIAGEVSNLIGAIVPVAVGIAGTIFVARRAMGWFKSMAK